jgi:hypothetical protein
MEAGNINKSAKLCLGLMLVATLLAATLSRGQQAAPHHGNNAVRASVSITGVPHLGPGGTETVEPISGDVRGVEFTRYKVVVYAFAGGTWWVQPTIASPRTDIDNAGSWRTVTHLGGTYAALLVRQSFNPPATVQTLPNVQGNVVAVDIKAGLK